MSTTTDPKDPRLPAAGTEPGPQHDVYLVLPPEEIAKGHVRPLRTAYRHQTCGEITRINSEIAATYAREPRFYTHTYCCSCHRHLPVDEFVWWPSGETVGT